MNFYTGIASRKGQGGGSPARDILTVKNKQDFLEGSFDDPHYTKQIRFNGSRRIDLTFSRESQKEIGR